MCMHSLPSPCTGQTVWHPCIRAAGCRQRFLRGMSHAASASHPSFLTVVDVWTRSKQEGPVYNNCNSKPRAACSPESPCGLAVGAACMSDTFVMGSTLAERQEGVLRQMHAVDCIRQLLSAIRVSVCTVSVSAAGAHWRNLFQSWGRASGASAGSPGCQHHHRPERCCSCLCRNSQGVLPKGTWAIRHPGQSPTCCRDSQGFCCECTLAQATSASFTSGSSSSTRAGLDCSLWSSDLFLNGVPGSASCMRYADLWYEVCCCCILWPALSW